VDERRAGVRRGSLLHDERREAIRHRLAKFLDRLTLLGELGRDLEELPQKPRVLFGRALSCGSEEDRLDLGRDSKGLDRSGLRRHRDPELTEPRGVIALEEQPDLEVTTVDNRCGEVEDGPVRFPTTASSDRPAGLRVFVDRRRGGLGLATRGAVSRAFQR
jgi:hypothetical protein